MQSTEKTAREISLELLDGWTTDTDTKKDDFTLTTEVHQNMFTAVKNVSVKDFQPKEAGAAFDRIRLRIMRDEIKPDEGTIRDIEWLTKYVEFGVFVQNTLPDWHRCDKCHLIRLCIHNIRDMSCECYECRYRDRVMENVTNGANMDSDPVRDFLQNGNLDPSKHWKTYQELIHEQFNFFNKKPIEEELFRGPYIPLKRMNNGI